MTLKEAQEVLGQKLNLAQFAEFVPEKTVVVTGEDVDRLLQAARGLFGWGREAGTGFTNPCGLE